MIVTDWTPDLDARLLSLRAKNLTFSRVAAELGLTKNQCLARHWRLTRPADHPRALRGRPKTYATPRPRDPLAVYAKPERHADRPRTTAAHLPDRRYKPLWSEA